MEKQALFSRIKQFFSGAMEKWPVKALSIAAAVVLVVFHRMESVQERSFSLPLKLEVASTLVPANSYAQNVRITLRGDANSIYPVSEGDIEVYLDLTRFREPASTKAPVLVRKKGTALEMKNLDISVDPLEVYIELDVKMSKYVAVVCKPEGNLEKGYELVSYTLEPNQAVVDGPMNLISTLAELHTEKIDLTDRNTDFALRLRMQSPNPLITIRGDGLADFRAVVKESIMIKSFENVPLGVSGLGEGRRAAVAPESALIRLEGPQREVEGWHPPASTLYVDLSGFGPGTHAVPIKATIPISWTLSRIEPAEATVIIFGEGE
jgi:YbbR domain-containing protein